MHIGKFTTLSSVALAAFLILSAFPLIACAEYGYRDRGGHNRDYSYNDRRRNDAAFGRHKYPRGSSAPGSGLNRGHVPGSGLNYGSERQYPNYHQNNRRHDRRRNSRHDRQYSNDRRGNQSILGTRPNRDRDPHYNNRRRNGDAYSGHRGGYAPQYNGRGYGRRGGYGNNRSYDGGYGNNRSYGGSRGRDRNYGQGSGRSHHRGYGYDNRNGRLR